MTTEGIDIKSTSIQPELLCSFIRRLLNKHAEKDQVAEDIREIYAEAKSYGFDKTALGAVITHLRKVEKNPEKEQERTTILETYLFAYEEANPSHTYAPARTHTRAREDKPLSELQRRYGMGA